MTMLPRLLIVASFFTGAIDNLSRWLDRTGSDGRASLNSAAFHHVMTLEPASSSSTETTSCDIYGGKLRLLFKTDLLGWNTGDCLADRNLSNALDAVDTAAGAGSTQPEKLPFATRLNVRDEYENEIGPILEKARTQLARPDLRFVPNFERNFAFMKKWIKENKRIARNVTEEWEGQLGTRTKDYFEGLVRFLEYKHFEDDEMLREGFFEAVDKAEVQFRIIDKSEMDKNHGRNCETVIEGGICYLQTHPEGYGWGTGDAAENLLDVL